MSISKSRKNPVIIILLSCLSFSCLTDGGRADHNTNDAIVNGPEWLFSPPHSENMIYGIGTGPDEKTAKQQALVDAAWQFTTQIKSVLVLQESSYMERNNAVLETFDEQLSRHTITGAKFVEKYIDADDQVWILAEAPLDCLLDGTESIFITYFLAAEETRDDPLISTEQTLKYTEEAYAGNDGEQKIVLVPPPIDELRKAVRSIFSDKIDAVLNRQNIAENIQTQGYVEPQFMVSYVAENPDIIGQFSVDDRLYHGGDYFFINKAPRIPSQTKFIVGWNSRPDGSGDFYGPYSLAKMGTTDLVLYPQIDDRNSALSTQIINSWIIPDKRTITIDGKMDDWIGINSVIGAPYKNLGFSKYPEADVDGYHFAMDEKYLYVMVRTKELAYPDSGFENRIRLIDQATGDQIVVLIFQKGRTINIAHVNWVLDIWEDLAVPRGKILVKQDQVLEVALSREALEKTGFLREIMKFEFEIREIMASGDSAKVESFSEHRLIKFSDAQ